LVIRIFSIMFPIFAVAAAGYAYGRWKRPDMSFANQLNMDVFVPALIFHVLSSESFDFRTHQDLALGGVAVVLGSGLLVWPLVLFARIQAKTFIPPMMFNNAGNMGLPLAVLAFGEAALPAAVVLFVVEGVLHFTLGQYLMDHRAGFLRILKIPMIQATAAGLVFNLAGWSLPQALAVPIEMLGQVAIPLLLFALGVRLVDVDLTDWRLGMLGAVLCPLSGIAAALIVLPLLGLPATQSALLVVFGALPPAVVNYIVAESYDQEPTRVASIVLLGNLLSVVSIPAVLVFVLR